MNTPKKFFWHAVTSSGGTLSINLGFDEQPTKDELDSALADAIVKTIQHMEQEGYIPSTAKLMSARDISEEHGRSRQYWEKLLSEGKILYKETAAGRITTDMWVEGYLGNKQEVDKYVRSLKKMLSLIRESKKQSGILTCTHCDKEAFSFHINIGGNTNGVCRNCNLYIHTILD